MESLIYVVVALLIFLLFLFQKNRTKKDPPPGPRGLPFVGNLFQVGDSSTLHLDLFKLSRKYGPLMSLRLGTRQTLVVSSPEMAKEVMKTHDLIFCSRPAFRGQQRLGYGVDLFFAPYDSFWREMRKFYIVHLLSAYKVQSFRSIRETEVSSMLDKISKSAMASKPVNLSQALMSFTCALTCRVGFGKKYGENEAEGKIFQELLAELQALFSCFFVSDYIPMLGFVDKLTGLIGRLEKNFKDFDKFYEQIIKEHLDPNRPKPEHEDILDVLLQTWKDNSFKIELPKDNIKAVLMNIFVGGTDTSSATVVWAMTLLMKNRMAMKKAKEEVWNVAGNKGFVNEDDIQQLSYLKAVVKETMRLQPTTPLLVPREASKDCKLGGYDIEAKTIVHVNTYAIGRDPEVWENPDDFCPERFIGKSIDLEGQDFELTPFGAGRRMCAGIHMALAIVELSLANLLHRFDWELPDGIRSEDIDMDALPGIVVHKKNPLCLMATPCSGAKVGM